MTTITTTYNGCHNILQGSLPRFRSISLPNQNNSIDSSYDKNIRNDHNIFMINQDFKMLLFCTAQDYNEAISHVIHSQIFDTARNAYCSLSDKHTDNSSCFLLW